LEKRTTPQGKVGKKRKKDGLKLSALHETMGLPHQPHNGGVKLCLRHAALSQSSALPILVRTTPAPPAKTVNHKIGEI
jgi:hypothetical protein